MAEIFLNLEKYISLQIQETELISNRVNNQQNPWQNIS